MQTGIELIAAERERQVSAEGWTPEHDDEHTQQQLALAAIVYTHAGVDIQCGFDQSETDANAYPIWPWDAHWLKVSDDPVRSFVKAGALIAAEIDRLQRKAQP